MREEVWQQTHAPHQQHQLSPDTLPPVRPSRHPSFQQPRPSAALTPSMKSESPHPRPIGWPPAHPALLAIRPPIFLHNTGRDAHSLFQHNSHDTLPDLHYWPQYTILGILATIYCTLLFHNTGHETRSLVHTPWGEQPCVFLMRNAI